MIDANFKDNEIDFVQRAGVWLKVLPEVRLNGKNGCDLHSRRFVEILWIQRYLSCYVGRMLLGTRQLHHLMPQFLLNGSLNPIVLKLEQYRQRLLM